MEKFWFCVLYLGLVEGSLVPQHVQIPQHVHVQQHPPHHGNQQSHGNNVRTSDLSSILKERIDSLHNMPHLISALEESAKSLERIPDIGRSLERISDLERLMKVKTESLSCKEAQKSIDKVQQMVQELQSNFEGLQQTVQNLRSTFSSRGALDGSSLSSSPGSGSSSGQDSDCICGLAYRPPQIEGQIIGGVETGVNEYPWQVVLTITFTSRYTGRQDSFRCGGSVISDQWVLTAAHCFAESGGVGDLTRLLVDLGDHDLSTVFETDSFVQFVPVDENHVLRRELQFGEIIPDNITLIVHPQYEQKNGIENHDYALIKLPSKIDWNRYSNIRPICLPTTEFFNFEAAIATGWGFTVANIQSFPDKLQEVTVRVISNAECNSIYNGIITDYMICAGDQDGQSRDACSGDSGGPLIATKAGNSGEVPGQNYELFGISSFGPGCGVPGRPGIYSRVSEAINWISRMTAGSFNGCPRTRS